MVLVRDVPFSCAFIELSCLYHAVLFLQVLVVPLLLRVGLNFYSEFLRVRLGQVLLFMHFKADRKPSLEM